jgi:hypothetical protein
VVRSHFAIATKTRAIACIINESSRLDYKERSPSTILGKQWQSLALFMFVTNVEPNFLNILADAPLVMPGIP